MVYVFTVWPSAAVTVHTISLSPNWRFSLPVTETDACASADAALTVILSVSLPTVAVYSVTSAEKDGDRLPGEICRSDSPASEEAPAAPAIVTAELPSRSIFTVWPSLSYTSWVLTLIWEFPAFNALNFSAKLNSVAPVVSAFPTTRKDPAPPVAPVPLTNSRAEES